MKNMKRRSLIIVCLCAVCGMAVAQKVSNVSAEQVGKNIVVSYDLDKASTISVCYSTDGGKTFSQPIKQVTGDVGRNVSAGHKQIIWNVLNEVEKLVCSNLVFKVMAGGGNEIFMVNGVRFEMVYVEGGTFTMGATSEQGSDAFDYEKQTHLVTLSDYYIGKYEVTQELWQAVMEKSLSQIARENGWKTYGVGANYPMYDISWNDCQSFINKLNSLLSSQLGGRRFALPTEAQWEYAARGGKKSMGYKYAGSNTIDNVAWYYDNSYDKGSSHPDYGTHTVGTKSPNELGLYDMTGNMLEWCLDWYGSYSSSSQTNPVGPSSGSDRVRRGGSWGSSARGCRVSSRNYYTPSDRSSCLGFRVVLLP